MNAGKTHVVNMLTLTLLAGSSIPVMAQTETELKPVVVASVSKVEEFLSDVTFLGELTGTKGVDWTQLTGVEEVVDSLDKNRPVGTIVRTDGTNFETLGFLPVHSLDALLEALKPYVGEPNDNGDGIYEFQQPVAFYVKHQNGWVFISGTMESLSDLPQDPVSLLGQLNHEYDVAFRAHVNNVPLIYRQMALGWVQFGFQEEMSQLDGLDDSQSELRRQWMNNSMQQMNALVNETDSLTIGWNVDQSARQVRIDVGMIAVDGTSSAERMKTIKMATSELNGFLLEDAAAAMHFHSEMSVDDIQTAVRMLQGVKTGALEQLGDDEELSSDEARDKAQQVLSGLFDVLVSTVESGHLEGGAALIVEPDSLALVVGGQVKDGQAFEQSLRNLSHLAHQEDGFPKVHWDAGEIEGIRIHTVLLPIEDEQIVKLVGDRLEIAMGTSPKHGYVAFGENAEALLERVIEKSAADREKILPPSQMVVALSPIVKYLESLRDVFPALQNMPHIELGASGRDRVVFETVPIERGAMSRIMLEEDAMRTLGELGRGIAEQVRAAVPAQLGQEPGDGF